MRGFHRNKRLVTQLKGQAITAAYDDMCVQPHMILIKPCKCVSVILSTFFTFIYFFFCLTYLCLFALLCEVSESIFFSDVWDAKEMRLVFFSEK